MCHDLKCPHSITCTVDIEMVCWLSYGGRVGPSRGLGVSRFAPFILLAISTSNSYPLHFKPRPIHLVNPHYLVSHVTCLVTWMHNSRHSPCLHCMVAEWDHLDLLTSRSLPTTLDLSTYNPHPFALLPLAILSPCPSPSWHYILPGPCNSYNNWQEGESLR